MNLSMRLLVLVLCLAAPLAGRAGESADATVALDARVTLDALRATVDARLAGVSGTLKALAATGDVRSGDWARIREPLAALAASTPEQAAVWFARTDGSYFTVDKGLTGESLHERTYFPSLLAGRDVIGALVISKSTGARSVIVASPVLAGGKVVGAIGVSVDAVKLAASLQQSIGFPPRVIFYALDDQGRTALHRAGDLIFAFPSDMGSPTLGDAVKTMLTRPDGVVHYVYSGSARTALFQRSALTGWVIVLGQAHSPGAAKPAQ